MEGHINMDLIAICKINHGLKRYHLVMRGWNLDLFTTKWY